MGASPTTLQAEQPRIYVACLAAYNSGHLHGVWIDADQEDWVIWEGVQTMLAASPIHEAEEWAIHDYEGFGGVHISEYASLDYVGALARFIAEHGALGAMLLEHYGNDLNEALEALEDRHLGEHASLAAYMQEVTEEAVSIPESLRCYIDWEAMARDAELSGDLFTLTTAWDAVHVFAGY